jgi:hypothetical protein
MQLTNPTRSAQDGYDFNSINVIQWISMLQVQILLILRAILYFAPRGVLGQQG